MRYWAVIAIFLCGICYGDIVNQRNTVEKPQATQQYQHSVVLDNDQIVHLYWEFNKTYINFEVHAQTTGWVGIGISPSGSMANADMYIGWVKNGRAYVTDRHGPSSGNSFPPLDAEQNIELVEGMECNGWTVIKFRRQMAACEANEDKEITSDTIRLIYAHGPSDPTADDITAADYHGALNRGTKSVLLLDSSGSLSSIPTGETHEIFDLLNSNFKVPALGTYYNCRLFKLPELPSKRHLVQIEPIVQAGHELYVHHIVLYQCNESIANMELVGTDVQCYLPDMPPDFQFCKFVIHGWAIGGKTFYYPTQVGFPLGTEDGPKYVLMETHYDNPDKRSDIVDSSGLRLAYTADLRQYDAAVMQVGHIVSGYQDIIPPNAESFLDSGECTDQCLSLGMEAGNAQAINVFAVVLHAHLLGTELSLKHVRNANELPHIAQDKSYDFNFQETRYLQQERVIQKGDALQMVCSYNSKSRRNVTVGGLGTEEEMCVAYIYYWPRIPLTVCSTAPEFLTLMHHFGVYEIRQIGQITAYGSVYSFRVVSPEKFKNKTYGDVINQMKWNESTADTFAEAARNMLKNQRCLGLPTTPLKFNLTYPPLQINKTYTRTPLICDQPARNLTTTSSAQMCISSTTAPTTSGSESVLCCLHVLFVTFVAILAQ